MHKVLLADVYAGLNYLEDNSIDIAVTSPPYWGQRDYEFKGQIGNESDYSHYINRLLTIFLVLKKKINSKGIFFLNIGDKYLSKYGNTPLGMIPYKLAYYMLHFGWQLEDIIIWYKPNHMPSSVKNRFNNTYEPVFVFSKGKDNFFKDFKQSKHYSNILKINTQPTPYKHMAVYPEKLVESLIKLCSIKSGTVLDPFAGSGTTAKAIINLNNSLENYNFESIMIERNAEFVNIIKERCGFGNTACLKIQDLHYEVSEINLENNFSYKNYEKINLSRHSKRGVVEIFDDKNKYLSFINTMINGSYSDYLTEDGIIYLGIKSNDIHLIYETSKLNDHGWVIRNQLIIKNNNTWYPIYFVVKDTKRINYHFNLDSIRVRQKNGLPNNSFDKSYFGLKVVDNLSKTKNYSGTILEVDSRYEDGFPKFVYVKWNDHKITLEYVIHNQDTFSFIKFVCPFCKDELFEYYKNGETKCRSCLKSLWNDNFSIPIIEELLPFETSKIITYSTNRTSALKLFEKNYNGKFKHAQRINMGASPGARSSTQEDYFSMQRFYDVNQAMIADYLNLKRSEKNLSKVELTLLFPKSYKHTVGHWLRKDMGGSLPQIEDWEKLCRILTIDKNYTNFVCRKGLKLQTVKPSHKGKNPGDFFDGDEMNINNMLVKTFI